jgi:hypothetical protein
MGLSAEENSRSLNKSWEICETISISKAALLLMLAGVTPSTYAFENRFPWTYSYCRIAGKGMKSPKLEKMK